MRAIARNLLCHLRDPWPLMRTEGIVGLPFLEDIDPCLTCVHAVHCRHKLIALVAVG